MGSKKTTHIRVYTDLVKELRKEFPNVKTPDLIQMMYRTSLIKLEKKLRAKNVKKK